MERLILLISLLSSTATRLLPIARPDFTLQSRSSIFSFEPNCAILLPMMIFPIIGKTASGFGGCNAAIVLDMKMRDTFREGQVSVPQVVAHYQLPASDRPFAEYIRTLFKSLGEDNMKFYKMSDMSKALYVAVEKLLAIEGFEEVEPTRRAIILANRSASLDSDWSHQQILNKRLPEGTSPAVFVYTLPNVSAGEICIRHKMQGDNTFFIENQDSGIAERYARSLIVNNHADVVICGWCEYLKGHWNVNVKLLKKIYNGTIDSGIKRTFD